MSKTAAGLVAFVKTKLGTPYVYGAKGTVLTQAKFNWLKKTYPNCIHERDAAKVGKVCVDCSGLISWYTGVSMGSSQYKSKATKVLPISQISQAVPGCALWLNGHIGVYIGNGECIEARGSAYGCVKTKVSQRNFTHILWINTIDYSDANTVTNNAPGTSVSESACYQTMWTKTSLNLRSSDIVVKNPNNSLIIIPEGTELKVTAKTSKGWYKTTYKGKTGYCSGEYLISKSPNGGATVTTPVNNSPTSTTLTTTGSVNFRSQPCATSSSLGIIKNGTSVTFLSDTGFGWSHVSYNGKTGYVSNRYLKGITLSSKKTMKNNSSSNVMMRSDGSTSASTVLKIPKGKTANVEGYIAGSDGYKWLYVKYANTKGYVRYDESYIGIS